MDLDLDPTVNKPLKESIHAKKDVLDKKDLLNRIGTYINSKEGVVGAEVLRLLRNVDTHFRNTNPLITTTAAIGKDAKNIQKALQTMQNSLDRIKKSGQAASSSKASYAATAAQGPWRVTLSSKSVPSNAEMLKEKRKAKEITIRIEDPKEIAELKGKSSKNIL